MRRAPLGTTRLASPERASEAAARRRIAFERVVVPLAVAGTLDLAAKHAVIAAFVVDERRAVVPHVLDLTLLENAHGAMGLFGDRPAVLVALALLALGALWLLLRTTLERSPVAQIGFGLVAGGALGNVTDRLVHGYVVDFIALPHFYVFNVADASISIGLALVALPALARQRTPLGT